MANPPRTRKRVHAICRASDGSAFEKCDNCGVLVAIALADMHECEGGAPKKNVKRFKGLNGKQHVIQQSFSEPPRSSFRLFMEDFTKTCKSRKSIDIDRIGLETWRNMSKEERRPYEIKADEITSAYFKSWMQDIGDHSEFNISLLRHMITCRDDTQDVTYYSAHCSFMLKQADDEADSAMVGKFDQCWEDDEYCDYSDNLYIFQDKDFDSFDTWEWEMVRTRMAKKGSH